MKLYREVKASERLPEGDCFIVPECVIMADNGKEYYKGAKDFETLTTWLEPVEITVECCIDCGAPVELNDDKPLDMSEWPEGLRKIVEAAKSDHEANIRQIFIIYNEGYKEGFEAGKQFPPPQQPSDGEIEGELLTHLIEFSPHTDWSELIERLALTIKELNR